MSKYIYDLNLSDWALNFAHSTDIENELDYQHITMSSLRKQFLIDAEILKYQVTTSIGGRRYLTLFVKMIVDETEYLTKFRLYSPFIPNRIKNLEQFVGAKISSIIPLCTVRHRRDQYPIIVLASARVTLNDGSIIIPRTAKAEDESDVIKKSKSYFGDIPKSLSHLENLNELDMLTKLYRDPEGFNASLDPYIKKKFNL